MEMATLPAGAAVSQAEVMPCLRPHLSRPFGPMQSPAGQSLGSQIKKAYCSPSSSTLRLLLAEHWSPILVRVHPPVLN